MSQDSYTEVTTQSWFSRIGGSIKGVLVGLLMFLAAFPVLFLNEGRAVKRQKSLEEGSGIVVSVSPDKVDPANAGKLIHLTGKATTETVLADSMFGVSVKALKLDRNVEMYQWKEEKSTKKEEKLGGSEETRTTYTYSKGWSGSPISSSGFKIPDGHRNPTSMPIESRDQLAERVTIGAFKLSTSLLRSINEYESVSVGEGAGLAKSLRKRAVVSGDGFYIGRNPDDPQVGDARVTFQAVKPLEVSIVSKQSGETFTPYLTKVGGTIELLETGTHAAEAMFAQAQSTNTFVTWVIRALGFILMAMGVGTVLNPLRILAAVVPFIGRLVGMGTKIISILVAGPLSLITIAIAWIVYRPLLGILLLAVAGGLIAGFVVLARRSKGVPTGVAPAA